MPRPSSSPTCPPDEELVELVEGRLDGRALGRLNEHVAACSTCASVLAGLRPDGIRGAPTVVDGTESVIVRALLEEETRTRSGEPGAAPARSGILERGASVGRYLVLSLIGRGGMGEVYGAYDPELDRRVALKLLHTARGASSSRRRLMREARALGKLSHPNVVQVYDVGEHGGDVFVAMELVEGQSLDAWCTGTPRPSWQEVLAAYLAAAGGLAAAHAKGIVHRDVKPANILRGKDGRVCVADFGLAAGRPAEAMPSEPREGGRLHDEDPGEASPLAETVPALSDSDDRGGAPITAAGALLGTPLYMAPEQFEGAAVGPASDQHSLCTALYWSLYGELPFQMTPGPARIVQLVARKTEGPPPSPPAGSPVPASIHRALFRGLAPRPEDRFPSMEALVEALREAREPPRRPWLRYAAIGAAAVVVALVAVWSGAFANPCAHSERQLVGAWDDGVRGRVRAALTGTGRSYADDTAGRVAAILDRYSASWVAMRGEVCEASRTGGQRRELVELRDACLDRRLGQIRALTGLLAEKPDVQILDGAVPAAAGLPPLASCADAEALSARVRPPDDPGLRTRVGALQPQIDRIAALYDAGKYKEGLPLAERLLEGEGAIPYPPVVAQIQHWTGRLRDGTGDYEGAKTLLRAASVSAAEGRDQVLAALAWARLLYVTGERQQRTDEAAMLLSLGPTVVAGAHDGLVRATWLNAQGLALWRMGKYPEAEDAFQRCLETYAQISAPETSVAATGNNLGLVLNDKGDYPRARAAHERALALREKVLGPDHPYVAASLSNLALVLFNLGEISQSRISSERALGIRMRALGPDNPDVALSRAVFASTLVAGGDYADAAAHLEPALAILEKTLGPDHPRVGYALNVLGYLRFSQGDYPQALAAYERALTIDEKARGPDHVADVGALIGVGRTRVRLGWPDAAEAVLERARAPQEKTTGADNPAMIEPLLALAELSLARRAPERALPLLERALSLPRFQELTSETQLTLADTLWQTGKDRARALALAEASRAGYAQIGNRPGVERASRWLEQHPGKE